MFSLLSYGEALIDFLPDNNNLSYYPLAGGAPANVAVAFAKLGGVSYFAGGISVDNFGEMIFQDLNNNKVNTNYIHRNKEASTALVLVSLDKSGERAFNFYRHETADTQYSTTDIDGIEWQSIDMFHFCSNTLTSSSMHNTTLYALKKAKLNSTLLSFDVNLRQQLWSDLTLLPERIDTCIKLSDIIKLSKDEAEYLALQAEEDYPHYLQTILAMDVKLILITDGANPIHIISPSFSTFIPVPTITATDTTAAGDSFIAGFLFSLTTQTKSETLDASLTDIDIVSSAALFAAKCGAFTCQKKGAFAALPSVINM